MRTRCLAVTEQKNEQVIIDNIQTQYSDFLQLGVCKLSQRTDKLMLQII